ncbi:MAG: aldose 1-epimerase family protein [Clostridia bacterium]|nr:aldose 1-epimerase family protein [Clostridia bacterium]
MNYTLKNDTMSVVISDFGAELQNITSSDGYEYLWQGDEAYWGRRAPILFPIVGKLKDDIYYYNDETYSMTQHGFARDLKFELVNSTKNSFEFSLTENEETLKKYPFKFELKLGYHLKKNHITVTYYVKNNDNKIMPFSIGAHPAFNWEKESSAYFEFETGLLSTYVISPDGVLDQKVNIAAANGKLRIHEALFKNDALIMDDIEKVTYWNENKGVEMSFKGFPYVGLWSKPTGAPFICIEPWHGIADFIYHDQNLMHKKDMIHLNPGEAFESEYIIKIL